MNNVNYYKLLFFSPTNMNNLRKKKKKHEHLIRMERREKTCFAFDILFCELYYRVRRFFNCFECFRRNEQRHRYFWGQTRIFLFSGCFLRKTKCSSNDDRRVSRNENVLRNTKISSLSSEFCFIDVIFSSRACSCRDRWQHVDARSPKRSSRTKLSAFLWKIELARSKIILCACVLRFFVF